MSQTFVSAILSVPLRHFYVILSVCYRATTGSVPSMLTVTDETTPRYGGTIHRWPTHTHPNNSSGQIRSDRITHKHTHTHVSRHNGDEFYLWRDLNRIIMLKIMPRNAAAAISSQIQISVNGSAVVHLEPIVEPSCVVASRGNFGGYLVSEQIFLVPLFF